MKRQTLTTLSVVALLTAAASIQLHAQAAYIGNPAMDGVWDVTEQADNEPTQLYQDHSSGALKAQTALFTASSELGRQGIHVAAWVEVQLNDDEIPTVSVGPLPAHFRLCRDMGRRMHLVEIDRIGGAPWYRSLAENKLDEDFLPDVALSPELRSRIQQRVAAHMEWHPWRDEGNETLGFILNTTAVQASYGHYLEMWQQTLSSALKRARTGTRRVSFLMGIDYAGLNTEPEVIYPTRGYRAEAFENLVAGLIDMRYVTLPIRGAVSLNSRQAWPIPPQLDPEADRERPIPILQPFPDTGHISEQEPRPVRVRFTIGADGRAHAVSIEDDVTEAEAEFITDTLSLWRFLPKRINGENMEQRTAIRFRI